MKLFYCLMIYLRVLMNELGFDVSAVVKVMECW